MRMKHGEKPVARRVAGAAVEVEAGVEAAAPEGAAEPPAETRARS